MTIDLQSIGIAALVAATLRPRIRRHRFREPGDLRGFECPMCRESCDRVGREGEAWLWAETPAGKTGKVYFCSIECRDEWRVHRLQEDDARQYYGDRLGDGFEMMAAGDDYAGGSR